MSDNISLPSNQTEPPESLLWKVTRYTLVAVLTGVLIWRFVFYIPTEYVNRDTTGATRGTHYIVKVARFPAHANWEEVADAIQSQFDILEHRSYGGWGETVDAIAEMLDERRIDDYFIELGTAVRAKGKKDRERAQDWIIGIEKPGDDFIGIDRRIPLRNQSFATLVGAGGTSVSVVAPSCAEANNRASELLAMFERSQEQGALDLANEQGIAVLFLLQDGNERASQSWTAALKSF